MASTTDTVQNDQSMFAYRYTAEDKEYQKHLQCSPNPPPMVEDWMNREPSVPSVPEILQNYESKFAHRFTSEDEEYQKYVQRPADPPPLIEDWQNRSGGNQRYRDRFRDNRHFRGRGHRYDQPGGYRSDHLHEKAWGTNYQQPQHGHPSLPQHGWPQHGHGSNSQGLPYGRY